MTDFEALRAAVIKGKRNDVAAIVQAAIDGGEDINLILDRGMIPAMREIGDKFSRNEAYVPELLIAARAMQAGLALLEPLIAASGRKSMGKVAIGTVKGDLHDIGKNLVAIMLKGAGYDVIDLGVNCDITKYEEGVKQGATIIGCSSLLTTTMPYMKEVVAYFKDKGVKVVIGGAPVTQAYADEIGADGYSEDANGAVKLIDSLLKTA
ncbi:corrinoid protein [Victivallis vadensis]|uniref:5-methyltetrahydrofolate--homocysteine methyltransferase n=1 Tax=Victivallis vadensis TaxID=172901 RepID=A0A2U1AJZ2_9BACT|nr:corrinoid protein [Victivallis vadensis]NMD86102.1 cobalamin-binding protein [Victivallis vadensis]PVY36705.1 5-methyltetrahydrofolate--homocysteine methyltransferase [Victivallis vadensis]PWM70588.1 MAG: cobalamin-binding protein [Lentisphaerota bacterium]HJH04337.1 corrinoid protein [Victivallis vadensis]